MRPLIIPFSGRQKYVGGAVRTAIVEDAFGKRQAVWPQAFEIPTKLVIGFADDRIGPIRCVYSEHLGEATAFNGFRLHDAYGVLAEFWTDEPLRPSSAAYERLRAVLERALAAAKRQADDAVFKWKTIFSVRLVLEEWERGGPALRELLANPYPLR